MDRVASPVIRAQPRAPSDPREVPIRLTKNASSIFISLASIHYRVGYLRSAGVNAYINFEQIFDTRQNMTGSLIGLSFSRQ